MQCVDGDPAAEEDGGAGGNLCPHHGIGFGRDLVFGKESVEAAAQDFGERGCSGGVAGRVLQGGLGGNKIFYIRRLVIFYIRRLVIFRWGQDRFGSWRQRLLRNVVMSILSCGPCGREAAVG